MTDPIPEQYRALVSHFIAQATEILKEGTALVPLSFIGCTTTQQIKIVRLDTQSADSKNTSAGEIAQVARALRADFVFTLTEAYASPADKAKEAAVFMSRGGRLSEFPGRLDIVSFTLETPEGCWAAMAPVPPHKPGVPRDMDVSVRFIKVSDKAGRFFGLLPPAMSRH